MTSTLSRADLLRGRLTRKPPDEGPLVATFGPTCLARGGTACRACEDHCPLAAIRFVPLLGGRSAPSLRAGLCDGCAQCRPICPVGAIAMTAAAAEG